MLVVEYERIELDACAGCGGVWFDAGEMDLLLETLGIAEGERNFDRLLADASDTAEAPRRCPLCRRKMGKARVGGEGPVVDRCVRGEGIWFDRGEIVPALAGAGRPTTDVGLGDRVAGFLREVFPTMEKGGGS